MQSKELEEVGKLAYLIGEIETTSNFKKMLDLNDRKSKFTFKCVDELPSSAYKKVKVECRRKGILRSDWFDKILDRSPMMIFMIFNFCDPLDKNEKWDDRLSIAIRKINKVTEILRYSNKEEIVLRTIIIISKDALLQTSMTGNVVQKINSSLKNYEKELNIFQVDQLAKQVNKNKSHWFQNLEKTYEKKYRSIVKRKEETFGERRLGCLIKMAVISEIISKKQSYSQYEEAYKSLHYRFVEMNKNKVEFINFDSMREVRTLADVVLIRMLKIRMSLSSNYKTIPETVSNHLKFFVQRNTSFIFNKIENQVWREDFLHKFEEVIHRHDYMQNLPKSFMAEIINSSISLCYQLSQSSKEISNYIANQEIKGRIIPKEENMYIGSYNYSMGIEITDADIVSTELTNILSIEKDYITKGMQTITRYKSMKLFKKNQLNLFNMFLLRFYLADKKFESMGNVFSQIISSRVSKHDFYLLNNLLMEMDSEIDNSHEHKLLIYGVAILISDYFNSQQNLEKYGQLFVSLLRPSLNGPKTVDLLGDQDKFQDDLLDKTKVQPLVFPILNSSKICSLQVMIQSHLHPIEETLSLRFYLKTDNKFVLSSNCKKTLLITFSHPQVQREVDVGNSLSDGFIVTINPLQYFSKDETLLITSAVLRLQTNPVVHFYIANVKYLRYEGISFCTKLQVPQITINSPYSVYYINETSKFTIQLGQVCDSVQLEARFTAKEEDLESLTQIYTDPSEKLNLINSKCYQVLENGRKNIFYLKCNKVGIKALKFIFHLTITQNIEGKQLRNVHTITRDIGFKVMTLFKTIKIMKESYTGAEVKATEIPLNKKILLAYSLRAAETVGVAEIGQNQNEMPCIKTYKQITPVEDFILTPEEKLKNIFIFQVQEDKLDKEEVKNIFLVSFYIKWYRIDLNMKLGLDNDEQIKNFYLEKQIKIGVKPDQVEVQYEQGRILKKKNRQTLSIRYRNLTNQKIHIHSVMENSESILRVGQKGKSMILGPHEIGSLAFQILPIKIGYHSFPQVRSFFDGNEAKDTECASLLCIL